MSTDEKEPKLTVISEDKSVEEKRQEILRRFKEREEGIKKLKENLEQQEKQSFVVSDKRKLNQPEEPEETKPKSAIAPQSGPHPIPSKPKPQIQRIPFADEILRKEIEKEAVRERNSQEIRCRVCRYSSTKDNFFYNPQMHTVICPRCGNSFMSATIRLNIMNRIRQQASGIVVPDTKIQDR